MILRLLFLVATVFLPRMSVALPVTWSLEAEIVLLQLGQFRPGFPAGRIVGDEFVPTRVSGSLSFDPSAAQFLGASNRPDATECLTGDIGCTYALTVVLDLRIAEHVVGGSPRASFFVGPDGFSLNTFGFTYDGVPFSHPTSTLSLQFNGPMRYVLPAERLVPPAYSYPGTLGLVFDTGLEPNTIVQATATSIALAPEPLVASMVGLVLSVLVVRPRAHESRKVRE